MKRALAIAFGLVTQILAGCVTQNTPGDLSLLSVKLVDHSTEKQLLEPADSISYFRSSAGTYFPNRVENHNPHEPLLLVTITSATDFSKLSFYQTLGVESHFCSRPSELVYLDSGCGIFSGGTDARADSAQFPKTRGPGNLFSYDVYFRLFRKASTAQTSEVQDHSFDLIVHPEDICLNIIGGAYRKIGYSSNTVIIPKADIAAAIANGLPKLFPELAN